MSINSKPWYWRSKKAWFIHVIGRNGKRSAKKLANKRKQAFEEYRKLLEATKATIESERLGDPFFEDVSDAWLERQEQRLEQGQVSAKWLDRACGTIARFKAAHPHIRVSEMTPAKVQSWLVKPSANYERTELGLLKQILTWALKKAKSIKENPLEHLDLPQMTSRTITITPEDHAKAMASAKHVRPLLEVAYLTGCRPGELRQLLWDQLADDLSEATLVVHKTSKKTGKVRRLIFPARAQEILAQQRRTSKFVFTNSRGFGWTSNAVVQAVRKIAAKSGVRLVAGVYRHTFATNALDKGVPIATVAQLLGHSSTAMVSRVYGHLAERVDHLKAAAETVASAPSSESAQAPKKVSAKRSAQRTKRSKKAK